jgi:predicted transcriptional regulator of viral defense system
VSAIAQRQWGRVSWSQLVGVGVSKQAVSKWVKRGYLHAKHPRVYAVGHDAPSVEADLAAALLYAGPGAMLSHGTAAWWFGLIDKPPSAIHVSTPRRCRSRRGVTVHQERDCQRVWHKGLPVTSVAQTLLDFAATALLKRVRVALANAEYHRLLHFDEVQGALGRGRPGSEKLRTALERHQPQLARTRSPTEVAFFELCESFGLPLPEVNARIAGWTVDFLWRREGVVVEVDPYGNHHTPAQVDRDRRKDLALRNIGLIVNRYSRSQVERAGRAIAADVTAALASRSRPSPNAAPARLPRARGSSPPR